MSVFDDWSEDQLRAVDEFVGTYEYDALNIAFLVSRMAEADLRAAVEGRKRKCAEAIAEKHGMWVRNPNKALEAIRLPATRQPGALILPFNGKFVL